MRKISKDMIIADLVTIDPNIVVILKFQAGPYDMILIRLMIIWHNKKSCKEKRNGRKNSDVLPFRFFTHCISIIDSVNRFQPKPDFENYTCNNNSCCSA